MKPVEEIARELDGLTSLLADTTALKGDAKSVAGMLFERLRQAIATIDCVAATIRARDEEHATALRAEREKHACPIGLDATPTVCSAGTCVRCLNDRIVGLMGRAEKAEAERDEALWDARFQIDAQVKSREAAEARAEKAEAERDEARSHCIGCIRPDEHEAALATARNRALEESAENAAAFAKACETFGHIQSNPFEAMKEAASSIATAILALRTKEGE